jgi:hypothetical protein
MVNVEPIVAATTITVPVSGVIATDTLWTNDNIYHVTGNILVNPSVVLTIQAGTVVKFDYEKGLVIRGTLVADGTPDQMIIFTAATTPPSFTECGIGQAIGLCPGEWGVIYQNTPRGGIVFAADSQPAQFDLNGTYQSGSNIRYAVIEHSRGGISVDHAAPFLDHNLLQWNREGAIITTMSTSGFTISHNRILNNLGGYVVNLVNGEAIVIQNLIAYNTGIAFRLLTNGGQFQVISNTIINNTNTSLSTACDYIIGIICLEANNIQTPTPMIQGNTIYGNLTSYDVVMGTGAGLIGNVNGTGNYWGTTDQAAIQARIYDFYQDIFVSVFTFVPYLTTPDPDAPTFPTIYLPLLLRN